MTSIVECAGKQGKQARIMNISSNPVLAAMEIRMALEEIKRLHCELAHVVLFDAMEKDGAICWKMRVPVRHLSSSS